MKSLIKALFLVVFLANSSFAQDYPEAVYTMDGLAIKGYDPVAYFDGEAKEGNVQFALEWSGSKWLFSSETNLTKFKEDPEKYAPEYGGYCAWGMSKGYKAKIDPKNAWTVFNGKLYLNYSSSIKKKWLPQKEELIKAADENWQKFD